MKQAQSNKVQQRPQGRKDKTTPRPWRLHREDNGDHCIVTKGVMGAHEDGLVIAVLDCENADEAVNVADGELIVSAVNEREKLRSAHDRLYVACRTAYVACRTAYDLLSSLSSDSFATGGDKAVRELLADAIDDAEMNGITPRKERES